MPNIFISYRREDSRAITGRLHDQLESAFGTENIFKDVDDIPPGSDFREVLREAIEECDVMLVVIGHQWVGMADGGETWRIEDPADFVRFEVATALEQPGMTVIPVLVDDATLPSANDLPEPLQPLAYRNAIIIRHDPDFRRDVQRMIDQLRRLLGTQETEEQTEPGATVNASADHSQASPMPQAPKRQGSRPGYMGLVGGLAILLIMGAIMVLARVASDDGGTATISQADLTARVERAATDNANDAPLLGWSEGTRLEVVEDALLIDDVHSAPEGDNVIGSLPAGEVVEVFASYEYKDFYDVEAGGIWFSVMSERLEAEGWVNHSALRPVDGSS